MANPFIQQASPMMAQSPQYAPQMMDIQRQQKLAEMLQEQALKQEQGQMVSGHYIRPSMLGGLAKVAGAYLSGKMQNDVAEKQAELLRQQQEGVSNWLSSMPKDQPGLQPQQLPPDVAGPPLTEAIPGKPVSREDKMAWLLRGAQVAPQLAGPMLQTELDDKPFVLGKSLVNKRGDVIGIDATWKEDQAAQREQRMAELKQRSEDARALQAERLQAQRELRAIMGAMRQPQAPVAVIGPDGNPVYVPPEKAYGKQPASGSTKPMTAVQEAKYRENIAKDYQAANTNLSNMDDVLKSIESVRNSPGLSGATGLQSYVPSFPGSDAATAEVRLKNLEGKITQLGKAAAAQGGSVGPMAVQEWKIVRDMIAAIDPAKGKAPLLEQIGLVESSVQGAAQRLRDAYEKQYSADFDKYPQFSKIGKPQEDPKPPPGMPPMDAIEAEIRRRKGGR